MATIQGIKFTTCYYDADSHQKRRAIAWVFIWKLGKLIGLDRVPEARCLRYKMDHLSQDGKAENWAKLYLRSGSVMQKRFKVSSMSTATGFTAVSM